MATLLMNSNLELLDVREAKGSEIETGAQAVFTYKCSETGKKINIFAQKNEDKTPYAWIPDGQGVEIESTIDLLISASDAIKTWAEHTIKFTKTLFLL